MLSDTIHGIPLKVKNGIVYHYDSNRDKHLSLYRTLYGFGLRNRNISHPRIMAISEVKGQTIKLDEPKERFLC